MLDAETTVEGYWSDGTANIKLGISLRNEGRLPFEEIQAITISCAHDGSEIEDCNTSTEISLTDGFSPAAKEMTLRVPMGTVQIEIGYGSDMPHTVYIRVPERILGVHRETWECYSDRMPRPSDYDPDVFDYGCYGWYSDVVQKWRTGSTVKVWETGNANYIRAFREMLDEQLAPVLNLDFEWVSDEWEADFVAVLGVSKFDPLPDRWARCPDVWGCAGVVDQRDGEIIKGYLTIYHLDRHDALLHDYPKLKKIINGILIHEALHALAPTGHAVRPKVRISVMRNAQFLTYMDNAILRLNSHPLVQPGMTMRQVEAMIVFRDELLDDIQDELTAHEMLEHTLATLQKVDTVRMKIRGSRTGGGCDDRFGDREWATLEIGNFSLVNDPMLAYFQDERDGFFIFYSDEAVGVDGNGWQHWRKNRDDWNIISGDELRNSTAWWVRNSKIHYSINELLWLYDRDMVKILDRSNGEITLLAEYDPSEFSPYGPKNEQLNFTLVIDANSYEIRRFEWIHRYRDFDYCNVYSEEGKDIEYGIEIEIPDAIVEGSKFALPEIAGGEWQLHHH